MTDAGVRGVKEGPNPINLGDGYLGLLFETLLLYTALLCMWPAPTAPPWVYRQSDFIVHLVWNTQNHFVCLLSFITGCGHRKPAAVQWLGLWLG